MLGPAGWAIAPAIGCAPLTMVAFSFFAFSGPSKIMPN